MNYRNRIVYWWLILLAAILCLLLSWKNARASVPATSVTYSAFATLGEPDFVYSFPGSGLCRQLAMYLPKDTTIKKEHTAFMRIESLVGGTEAEMLVLPQCSPNTLLSFPAEFYSPYDVSPFLVASVSGKQSYSQLSSNAGFTTLLQEGYEPLRLLLLFPSSGDVIFLSSPSAVLRDDLSSFLVTSTNSWGDVFQVHADGESEARANFVLSSLLQPTAENQVQQLVGCQPFSAVFFPFDNAAPCIQTTAEDQYFSHHSIKKKNLFQRFDDGRFEFLSWPPSEKPTEHGQVMITEVMWMGSFRGSENKSTDEWIELYNPTGQRFDLRGLKIEGAAQAGGTLVVNVALAVEPYGYVVIGRRSEVESQLNLQPDWVTPLLSISNEEAKLVLKASNGVELDRTPQGAWGVGLNDTGSFLRASAQRRQNSFTNNEWSSWGSCLPSSAECLLQQDFWDDSGGQNLGTPWQPTVL